MQRIVFCPGVFATNGVSGKLVRSVWQHLEQSGKPLFLALHPNELSLLALPGHRSLHSPLFPERNLQALRAADIVITFHPQIRDFAKAQGRNAFCIDLDLDLPPLVQGRDFPESPKVTTPARGKLTVATLFDAQYFPAFLGLKENLQTVHSSPVEWHVLALDARSERQARAAGIASVHTLSDVCNVAELPVLRSRPKDLRAFTAKPLFLSFLARHIRKRFLFCDTDLYFFRSPARLLARLSGPTHSLFFPQWNDDLRYARLHGLYNTGLMALSAHSLGFLTWWKDLCLQNCSYQTHNGFFIDQGFADLAPVSEPGIEIYRDGDENAGFWNQITLRTERHGSAATVFGEKPLGSFHAAGPDTAGLFGLKTTLDQIEAFQAGVASPQLTATSIAQQRAHWPELAQWYRLNHSLQRRLGRNFLQVPARGLQMWLSPELRPLRSQLSALYRAARRVKHRTFKNPNSSTETTVPNTPTGLSFWPDLQNRLAISLGDVATKAPRQ